eukprot:gnl/MRDRNA2_/MRDRNA2_71987_c0_seq2.p1 gnl/MRDRNA2_/MRDRNA2_71987_c0~~gnl/MRDRNA2_/MRDRNA2_71987_c0_seq2.p1  ORF type:complete len:916 (+),score=262.18 gnl/MRDRNA2_/MRDRNA2_71987_c0_seq2:98-2845(+)
MDDELQNKLRARRKNLDDPARTAPLSKTVRLSTAQIPNGHVQKMAELVANDNEKDQNLPEMKIRSKSDFVSGASGTTPYAGHHQTAVTAEKSKHTADKGVKQKIDEQGIKIDELFKQKAKEEEAEEVKKKDEKRNLGIAQIPTGHVQKLAQGHAQKLAELVANENKKDQTKSEKTVSFKSDSIGTPKVSQIGSNAHADLHHTPQACASAAEESSQCMADGYAKHKTANEEAGHAVEARVGKIRSETGTTEFHKTKSLGIAQIPAGHVQKLVEGHAHKLAELVSNDSEKDKTPIDRSIRSKSDFVGEKEMEQNSPEGKIRSKSDFRSKGSVSTFHIDPSQEGADDERTFQSTSEDAEVQFGDEEAECEAETEDIRWTTAHIPEGHVQKLADDHAQKLAELVLNKNEKNKNQIVRAAGSRIDFVADSTWYQARASEQNAKAILSAHHKVSAYLDGTQSSEVRRLVGLLFQQRLGLKQNLTISEEEVKNNKKNFEIAQIPDGHVQKLTEGHAQKLAGLVPNDNARDSTPTDATIRPKSDCDGVLTVHHLDITNLNEKDKDKSDRNTRSKNDVIGDSIASADFHHNTLSDCKVLARIPQGHVQKLAEGHAQRLAELLSNKTAAQKRFREAEARIKQLECELAARKADEVVKQITGEEETKADDEDAAAKPKDVADQTDDLEMVARLQAAELGWDAAEKRAREAEARIKQLECKLAEKADQTEKRKDVEEEVKRNDAEKARIQADEEAAKKREEAVAKRWETSGHGLSKEAKIAKEDCLQAEENQRKKFEQKRLAEQDEERKRCAAEEAERKCQEAQTAIEQERKRLEEQGKLEAQAQETAKMISILKDLEEANQKAKEEAEEKQTAAATAKRKLENAEWEADKAVKEVNARRRAAMYYFSGVWRFSDQEVESYYLTLQQ